MGEVLPSSTQVLLESRDAEISILRPQLARRDTLLQNAETDLSVCAVRLRNRETENDELRERNDKLQTVVDDKCSEVNKWRQKWENERKFRAEGEEKAVNTARDLAGRMKETFKKEYDSLKLQYEQKKVECDRVIRERELEEKCCKNFEEECARRKKQAQDFAEKWQISQDRVRQMSGSIEKKDQLIAELREQIEGLKTGTSDQFLSVTTKLSQKRTRIVELEEELRIKDMGYESEIKRIKADLEKRERDLGDCEGRLHQSKHEIVLKQAELESLRARLGQGTPKKSVDRTREDLLVKHIQMLTDKIDNWKHGDNGSVLPDVREQMGVLKTTNSHLQEKITSMQREKINVETELVKCKEELLSLKGELERLRTLLEQKSVDSETTSQFLLDEQSKLKQQKADIRLRLLEAERELVRLKTTTEQFSKEKFEASQIALQAELEQLKGENGSLRVDVVKGAAEKDELQMKLKEFKERSDRTKDSADHKLRECRDEVDQLEQKCANLQQELKKKKKDFDLVKMALTDIDEQCNILEMSNERLKQQLVEKEQLIEICVLTHQTAGASQEQMKNLMRERDHLSLKCQQIQEELTATHQDYREQLQKDALKSKMLLQEKSDAMQKLAHLETMEDRFANERSQLQDRIEGLTKHIQTAEYDKNRLFEESSLSSDHVGDLLRDNERLKDGLAQAVSKLERDRALVHDLQSEIEELKIENDDLNHKLSVESKDKDRLQSRIDLRASASPQGSSLSRVKEDLKDKMREVEELECNVGKERKARVLLETRYKQTSQDLAELRRKVYESQSAPIPSNLSPYPPPSPKCAPAPHNTFPYPPPPPTTAPASPYPPPPSPIKQPLQTVDANAASNVSAPASRPGCGTMRHEIPHRWKKVLIMRPGKCVACLEGLAFAKHGLKCLDCDFTVHPSCARNLQNTCGLPMLYTDYYLDIKKDARRQSVHETPSEEGRMTGWVKLWRSDKGSEGWKDAWGCMDGMRLSFFPQEDISANPIESINLQIQKWKLHFQSGVDAQDSKAIKNDDIPFLVEIKVIPEESVPSPYRLYLMAPTLQAKQRWVNALQIVTTKKVFTRRVSSLRIEDNGFLHLEPPHNVTVYCADVLDSKYLLLGCQQGLYYTLLALPEIPVRVDGLDVVYQMQVYPDIDTVVIIYGTERNLGAVHLGEVRGCMGSRTPGVKVTSLGLSQCHIFTSVIYQGKRYLSAADPNQVKIMAYSQKLGFFKETTNFPTVEPVSTLKAIGQYILIGAEKFLVADVLQNDIIAPVVQDYPVGAVVVGQTTDGSTEVLLAFHNYGVFVDTSGHRSRNQDVEWTRTPLDFGYTAPYLFVVHYDSVEVFKVTHIKEKDKSPLTPICLLELACPRILCSGPKQGDLMVAQHKPLITNVVRINVFENPDLLKVSKEAGEKRKQVAFGENRRSMKKFKK